MPAFILWISLLTPAGDVMVVTEYSPSAAQCERDKAANAAAIAKRNDGYKLHSIACFPGAQQVSKPAAQQAAK